MSVITSNECSLSEREDDDEWVEAFDPIDSVENMFNSGPRRRVKRQQTDAYNFNVEKTRCPLLLVADYRFFREMGGSSYKTTVNYLVSRSCHFHSGKVLQSLVIYMWGMFLRAPCKHNIE